MPTVTILGTRINDAVSTTNWGNDGGGGGVAAEPDIVYQGTGAQSRKVSTTIIGRNYTHGSGTSILATNTSHWMAKINATNFAALEARGTPALHVKFGSSSSIYYVYYLFGNDNYPARGGWQLIPISPRVMAYRDNVSGLPNPTGILYWSLLGNFSSSSKSENVVIDAIDLTRGWEISSTAASFASFLTADEGTSSARYGHVYAEGPVLLVNGLLAIGQASGATASVAFSAITGGTMVWRNGLTETGYHKLLIDLGTAGTTFAIDGWTLQSTGQKDNNANRSYVTDEDTRTQLEVVGTTATATATIQNTSIQNFSKITLTSKMALTGCSVEAERIIQGSADITDCKIETTSIASRATLRDPVFGTSTDLNNTEFSQAGTGHAVQLDDSLGSETAASLIAGVTSGSNTLVAWPTHVANDVAILAIETSPQDIVSQTSASRTLWNSIGTWLTSETRLSLYWARATGVSDQDFVMNTNGLDHIYQVLRLYRGCATVGLPWADFQVNVETSASTTVNVPAVTTKADGQFVVGVIARGNDSAAAAFSGHTNAGLTSITEDHDAGTANGDGGGINLFSGTDTTKGSTGTTSVTDATSQTHISAMFAMRGVASAQARGGYQAAQTLQSGTGTVAVSWPTHVTDDVAFLIAETEYNETPTLSTPAGFTLVGSQASTAGTGQTQCTVWWHRATSGAMAAPTIADAGDHVVASMVTFRGLRTTGNPWDAFTQAAGDTASTSQNFPAVTTVFDGQRVMGIMTRGTDAAGAWGSAHTNAGLTGITERFDNGAIDGTGGGINMFTATDTTKGSTGTTSMTLAASSKSAAFTFALAAKEASYSLTNMDWTGYGANDTTSAAIWIPDQGGQYVLSVSGGSTPTITTAGAGYRTQNTVNVTLNNVVVGSRCIIYETANPSNVLMDLLSDTATETVSYNYLSDLAITIRVRKSSAAPKYLPYEATGTVTNAGFSLNVAQVRDIVAV